MSSRMLRAVVGTGVLMLGWIAVLHGVDPPVIRVDADVMVGSMYSYWSTSVNTSQGHFADPSQQERIRLRHPLATYTNCVRLLGGIDETKDDYFRGVDGYGEAICDFTEALVNIQGIIDTGFTPRLVLDNVPIAMSEQPVTLYTYGNTAPPEDPNVWHSYIRQFVQALVDEFGYDEVSSWRFRVGTEPDLFPGHWCGTEAEYYEHYDYTVDAVTSVIPDADIGPGNVLNPNGYKWGLNIIDHCATGTNYKTGGTGTYLTYLPCTWYGQVAASTDLFDSAIDIIKARLAPYAQFADMPIEVQEFTILSDENGVRHGGDISEWGASWMAAISQKAYTQGVANVFQWGTTDGLIPKPSTNVFYMMEPMVGGQRLATQTPVPTPTEKIGGLAVAQVSGIDLLLYRHRLDRDNDLPVPVRVELAGDWVANGAWTVASGSVIDHDHSVWIHNFYQDLADAGIDPIPDSPIYGSSIKLRYGQDGVDYFWAHVSEYDGPGQLAALAPLPELTREENGEVSLVVDLSGHHVVSLHLDRADPVVEIVRPNGGETAYVGYDYEIVWVTDGTFTDAHIEYSTDGGANWNTIAASTPNDGSYTWLVPAAPGANCLVRVSDSDDGDPSDQSDAPFAIAESVSLRVTGLSWSNDCTAVVASFEASKAVRRYYYRLFQTQSGYNGTSSPFAAFTGLAEGYYLVIVTAKDADGFMALEPARVWFYNRPLGDDFQVYIESYMIDHDSITFDLAASRSASRYYVRLYGVETGYSACNGSVTYGGLADGMYYFVATGKEAGTGAFPAAGPARQFFYIDTDGF